MNIILGITGSIAAYKAADIANKLTKKGHEVHVIMTKGGCEFITPLTLQTLTKNRVYTDVFVEDNPSEVTHIALAGRADLMLIAPASADFIAKANAGIADDMLTSVLLAYAGAEKPVMICPAMNTHMYENKITQRNIESLKVLGYEFIEPRSAMLACGDVGKGALADIDDILAAVEAKNFEGNFNENTVRA